MASDCYKDRSNMESGYKALVKTGASFKVGEFAIKTVIAIKTVTMESDFSNILIAIKTGAVIAITHHFRVRVIVTGE